LAPLRSARKFRNVTLDEVLKSVRAALDCGLNFIDTSPFYGRGMSEVLLGVALKGVPRESYSLCTKLGHYDLSHFDFSAKRVGRKGSLLESHGTGSEIAFPISANLFLIPESIWPTSENARERSRNPARSWRRCTQSIDFSLQ
jgi:hypothetical protein